MLIPIKHDSANGEEGVSPNFGEAESVAVEKFKKQIMRDSSYIPKGSGADLPFDSFVAAFYLIPEKRIAGVMWIYLDYEVLRKSLFFTTFRVPLAQGNPYSLAGVLAGDALRESIYRAIQDRTVEVEIDDSVLGEPVRPDPLGIGEAQLGALKHLREVDLLRRTGEAFHPFISFKPSSVVRLPELQDNPDIRAKADADSGVDEPLRHQFAARVRLPQESRSISRRTLEPEIERGRLLGLLTLVVVLLVGFLAGWGFNDLSDRFSVVEIALERIEARLVSATQKEGGQPAVKEGSGQVGDDTVAPAKLESERVYVTTGSVNIRSSPSAASNANIIGKLPGGVEITSFKEELGWVQVRIEVWVNKSNLRPKEAQVGSDAASRILP